jgi:hypothetical protein
VEAGVADGDFGGGVSIEEDGKLRADVEASVDSFEDGGARVDQWVHAGSVANAPGGVTLHGRGGHR